MPTTCPPAIGVAGEPPPPATPLKVIVVAPEKIMVVQVLLSLRSWASASCTAICAPGSRYIRHSALVNRYAEMRFDGSDDESFIAYVNDLERQSPGQLLIAADTAGSRLINRVRSATCVKCAAGPTDRMLDMLDDKWQFHQLCSRLGLGTPQTLYVDSKFDIDFNRAANTLGLPFFIKPAQGAQSRGAHEIASRDDLNRLVLNDPRYDYGPLLLQQLIRGLDVCANIYARSGELQAIAMQTRRPPYQVDSAIKFVHFPEFEEVACKLCAETAYDGPMHVDARVEARSGRLWLFEANPRYWRSMSASTWAGLNFVAEHLGEPSPDRGLRRLCSGEADTFHHPLVRPALWRDVLLGSKARGRLARMMAADVCTLMNSMRKLVKGQ